MKPRNSRAFLPFFGNKGSDHPNRLKLLHTYYIYTSPSIIHSNSPPSHPSPFLQLSTLHPRNQPNKMLQAEKGADHSITLSGSADLVTDFFSYGVNTLLYQRGIYSVDTFSRISKYGLTMLISTDPRVIKFLDSVLQQMRIWLQRRELKRVVVLFASVATKKVLERWAFDINLVDDHQSQKGAPGQNTPLSKEHRDRVERDIVSQIQAVIRQITASVTFLPLLDEPCAFDMLIYTNQDIETPAKWLESSPRIIPDKENVQLRSFSTNLHNVAASVSYAKDDS